MKLIQARVEVRGVAPILFSRPGLPPKNKGEDDCVYEERIWRERAHVDVDGNCVVTPDIIKNSIADAGRYTGEKIKGQGQKRYTDKLSRGVMIVEPALLLDGGGKPIPKGATIAHPEFGSSRGQRGQGPKVWKTFPRIDVWSTNFAVHIIDPLLQSDPDKIREFLEVAGMFTGWGKNRAATGGIFGRFNVEKFSVQKGSR